MNNSKVKAKKNLIIIAGSMSQKEFKALIKETKIGAFYSYDELLHGRRALYSSQVQNIITTRKIKTK